MQPVSDFVIPSIRTIQITQEDINAASLDGCDPLSQAMSRVLGSPWKMSSDLGVLLEKQPPYRTVSCQLLLKVTGAPTNPPARFLRLNLLLKSIRPKPSATS